MRNGLVAALALVVSAAALYAQNDAATPPPNVRLEGVPEIPAVVADAIASYGDFRQATLLAWHPTERRILIETTFSNVSQVHEVRAPGGARTQLTFFKDGIPPGGPAWYSPDGRYVLLRKDVAVGAEDFQFFRYDFDTGVVTRLTEGVTKAGIPVWAHRRPFIAYDSSRRDGKNRDLWVMDPSDPKTNRMVAEMQGTWNVLDWSADDTQLLVSEVVSPTEQYLWKIKVATGEKTPFTQRGGKPVRWSAARIDRAGRYVYAYGTLNSNFTRVWRADLTTAQWKALTPEGQLVEGFELSPDGKVLAVVFDRDPASELQFLDAVTGRVRSKPRIPVGTILNLLWSPKSNEVAFTFQGARTFRDVYSVDIIGGRVQQWTASETAARNLARLPDAEVITWKSFDGLQISGVMYRPAPTFTGPRPVIINIHGGPVARERPRNLGRSNHFRNDLGVAIIYPNIRGSSGRGADFDRLDDGRLRENAIKDIGALLDWICTQPYLDKTRVLVSGASHGGYLALASAMYYGDRIRAVTSIYGMTDLVDFLQTTDIARRENREGEYGDPKDPEMRKYLDSISPLPNAAKIKVPVYLVHGKNDTRIRVRQVERFAAALKDNGTPVWLIVLEDQGHLQLPTAQNNFTTAAWVMFAQRYLLN
jgi:dipeptidyl aminopeptidase/acylaminoacyl peptidase